MLAPCANVAANCIVSTFWPIVGVGSNSVVASGISGVVEVGAAVGGGVTTTCCLTAMGVGDGADATTTSALSTAVVGVGVGVRVGIGLGDAVGAAFDGGVVVGVGLGVAAAASGGVPSSGGLTAGTPVGAGMGVWVGRTGVGVGNERVEHPPTANKAMTATTAPTVHLTPIGIPGLDRGWARTWRWGTILRCRKRPFCRNKVGTPTRYPNSLL